MTDRGEWTTSTSGLPLGMDEDVRERRPRAAGGGRADDRVDAGEGSANGPNDAVDGGLER